MASKKTKPDVEVISAGHLSPDVRNANKHTERGMQGLRDSLTRHGFGRPTLADKNLNMIAGNATLHSITELASGTDPQVIVIRTRGDKMIVHVREDLDLNDPETRRLALDDNRIAEQNLDWDAQILHEFDAEGVDLAGLWTDDQLDILRQAKYKPTDMVALPDPAAKANDHEDHAVMFSAEQWKTIAAAVEKLNGESAGLELTAADALTIIAANYVRETRA